MIEAIRNAFLLPDLRRKVVFTLLILLVYRAATQIPVPTVDANVLAQFLGEGATNSRVLDVLNLLSGGALLQFSILSMGVYPYITASIIMQLLTPMLPALEELSKEGEQGRNKINQYTHWLAVPLAALQAYGQVIIVQNIFPGIIDGFGSDWLVTMTTIISMTAGCMFAVWLGELISEQGIGNGISIIIFGGIVVELPRRIVQFIELEQYVTLIVFIVITIITVLVIVMINEGQRRIPVQYGKRVRGNKVYGGQSTHIPLKVNSTGMIPLILAQSIMIFPSSIASFFATSDTAFVALISQFVVDWFSPETNWQAWPYWLTYFLMVALFTFFYTDILFRQQRLAENLQRQGGFISGIRPGKATETYLTGIIRRITLVGALFLGGIAILPWIVQLFPGLGSAGGGTETLLITSTGLLIVVGVALDTMKQLESQLLMRRYEGFIR